MARVPNMARGKAWGILNPFGNLWTYDHFPTPEAAQAHVVAFWRGVKNAPDLTAFRPVRVRVTVSVLRDGASSGSTTEPITRSGMNQ